MMKTKVEQDFKRIRVEAAKWVSRLHSGEVTDEQRRDFSRWIRQSPEHRREFFSMREIMTAVESAAERRTLPESTPKKATSAGLALAVCLLVSLVTAFFQYRIDDYWLADYSTAPGQQESVVLTDGSRLYLNTDSALAVDFNGFQRRIELLRGEVEFVVAHDPDRPFTVTTKEDEITALGTDFCVR
jgi:transmembrane sensor